MWPRPEETMLMGSDDVIEWAYRKWDEARASVGVGPAPRIPRALPGESGTDYAGRIQPFIRASLDPIDDGR